MNYPRWLALGPTQDYLEYPGERRVTMVVWSFLWPYMANEQAEIDGRILACLQQAARTVPQTRPRVIWRTLGRTLPNGRPLARWKLATTRASYAALADTLRPLADEEGCTGAAEEDQFPHAGDLFGNSVADRVPYDNWVPWSVIIGTTLWIYGSPVALPPPFCTTVPARRVTIGFGGGTPWTAPSGEYPFPWTPEQWMFLRFAAVTAAGLVHPLTGADLMKQHQVQFGTPIPAIWAEWWHSPLFHGIIAEGVAQLRHGKAQASMHA